MTRIVTLLMTPEEAAALKSVTDAAFHDAQITEYLLPAAKDRRAGKRAWLKLGWALRSTEDAI